MEPGGGDDKDVKSCLEEITSLEKPVTKATVIKYVILRWFLSKKCRFENDHTITNVQDIRDWKVLETTPYTLHNNNEQEFSINISDTPSVKSTQLLLAHTGGVNGLQFMYDSVPEFVDEREITPQDERLILTMHTRLQEMYDAEALSQMT